MKKHSIYTCLILLVASLVHPLIAQEKQGKIQGKIIDTASQSALELASISVFQQHDSVLLTGDLSAKDGSFAIAVPYGSYFVNIAFIGLAEQRIDSLLVNQNNRVIDLGEIALAFQSTYLDEVTINGERSMVQIELDKRIYHVGKDLSNAGGSAMEVLDNIPSVSVEANGAVSLRGNRGVQILIDGKPSGMVSNGNTTGLQSLSADMIDRVEVITNPSVKYEAEGTAGILNIVMKREKKKGINGSASLTAGHPSLFNTALSINLKRDRFTVFGNASFRNDRIYGIGEALQKARLNDDSTEIFKSRSIYNSGGPLASFRIGSDIHASKHLTLTALMFYLKGKEANESDIIYDNFQNSLEIYTGGSTRIENRLERTEKKEYVATMKKTFERNQQDIIADIRFQDNTNVAQSDFLETFVLGNGLAADRDDLRQQSAFQEAERRLIAKLDYTLPLKEDNTVEAGWQSSLRTLTNDFSVEEYLESEWLVSEAFSNVFAYDEQIHAAYGMYKNKIKGFSFQLGMRSEYTIVETSSAQNRPKTYLNFFPSLHLSNTFPNQHSIQASYTRRIRRPRSQSLNPYIALDDSRAFFSGNPDLDPEMTDTYEIGHVKKWSKGSIGSFVFYRHTVNVIEGVVQAAETAEGIPVFYRRPENLVSKDDVGLEFNLSIQPSTWWRINSDIFLYRAAIDGTNISKEIVTETMTGFARITSKITMFKDVNLQVRLNYSAPRNIPQGRRKSMTFLNLGFSKNILKDRGKLSLNISDLFQSRRIQNYYMTDTVFRENDYRWSRRTIRLTLSYRIKK